MTVPENAHIVYPLTARSRGRKIITQSDKRNTKLGRARLAAQVGEGNVIVIPDYAVGAVTGSVLAQYSQENFNPLSFTNASTPVSTVFGGNTTTVAGPQALSVLNTATVAGANGNATVNVTVGFTDVSGATSYDFAFVPSTPSLSTQSITGLVATSTAGTKIINATWNIMSNASSYTLQATANGVTTFGTNPVIIGSGSITVPSAGTYTVTITPYNTLGLAGIPGVTTVVVA